MLISYYFQSSRKKLVCLVNDINAKTGKSINNSVGVPAWRNWRTIELRGESFYIMLDHFMTEILEDNLFDRAHEKYPDRFGNADPAGILEALWECSKYDSLIGDYEDFLRRDSFFSVNNRAGVTLKLPLFRLLDRSGKEFKGGILHLLKHFQVNGKAVSTASQQHEFTEGLLIAICETFFYGGYKDEKVIERTVESKTFKEFDRIFDFVHEGEKFRMITRYGGLCDLFFISTIIPQGNFQEISS